MSHHSDTAQSIIQPLPPEVSNKIAAGEVIQRPSSVVKELIDNALDAGCSYIKVVIQNAGRTLIQVIDDGSGMGREDIPLCFEQHATSKIHEIDDLFKVRTLGFRGEAMASIASVAQVTLKTKRPEDDAGYKYTIWGGEERAFEPAAVDDGTSVAVRNLFFNVPARRQFLKTDATEFRHILRTVQQAALANTDIGFSLTADGDKIYELPAEQPLKERVADMFGKNYRASLVAFQEATSYVTIGGLLGDPNLTKRSRGEQFLFVNGRPFQHRLLTYIVLKMYEGWVSEKEYPFFAVYLDIDPKQVDVNVHPAKEEVKFEDERSIIKLTKSVVRKALNEQFMVPDVEDNGHGHEARGKRFSSSLDFSPSGSGSPVNIPSRINFEKRKIGNEGDRIARDLYDQNRPEGSDKEDSREQAPPAKLQRFKDRGFWQLHNTYILTQTRSGLCMIDQHLAHKRIIYEKALSATESALPSTQQLLFAQTIEFSATDFSLLKELHPVFKRMGFNIELLSGNTAIVSGVPADIDIGDEQQVIKSMLSSYKELDSMLKLDARYKLAIAFAGRTAVPRGRKLTGPEMENLLDQLFACEEPYLDPLKKPTIVYIPLEDIERRFK